MGAARINHNSSNKDLSKARVESHIAKLLRAKRLGIEVDRKNKAKERRKRHFKKDGIEYASLSERACVELMEKYISWFQVKKGKTYEIPIGKGQRQGTLKADFRLGNTLVEFHYPRIFYGKALGDFLTLKQKRLCSYALDKATGARKGEIRGIINRVLLKQYSAKRNKIINQNPLFRDMDLIVVSTPEEFYQQVIKKFANKPLPSQHRFIKQWHRIMRRLKKEIGVTRRDKQDRQAKRASEPYRRSKRGKSRRRRGQRNYSLQKARNSASRNRKWA